MINSLLIALGLNFDTFSISIIEGAQIKNNTIKESLKMSLIFGFVQGIFTLVGVFFGIGFKSLILNIDHWIAFILLFLIGIKFISEADKPYNLSNKIKFLSIKTIFLLAIATSVDALVVGISLVFISRFPLLDVVLIGMITFIATYVGFAQGRILKKIFKNKTKIIGGLILISIGIKIFIQHLFF